MGVGAGVWAATGSPWSVPAAVATGVLIDSDHITDLVEWYWTGRWRYLIRLFHAWEYTIIGATLFAGLSDNPVILAAVLGHAFHLFIDHLTNRVPFLGYFILYRAMFGFKRRWRVRHSNGPEITPMVYFCEIPFGRRLAPWVAKLVYKRHTSLRQQAEARGSTLINYPPGKGT